MPSPRNLDEVMKVEQLLDKTKEEVADIWMQYHSDPSKNRVGGVLSAAEYDTLKQRAKESPLFVVPVGKPGGGFLTMLMQCQMPFVLFTSLEEFRRNPSGAPPHFTLTHYPELLDSKHLALVRGDVVTDKVVSVQEGAVLLQLCRAFYTHDEDYKLVHDFNHSPAQFDFDALLRKLGHQPQQS